MSSIGLLKHNLGDTTNVMAITHTLLWQLVELRYLHQGVSHHSSQLIAL